MMGVFYAIVLVAVTSLSIASGYATYPGRYELEGVLSRLQEVMRNEEREIQRADVQWPTMHCDYWTSINLMDLALTAAGKVCLVNSTHPDCRMVRRGTCRSVCWNLNGRQHVFKICTEGQGVRSGDEIKCLRNIPFPRCRAENEYMKLESITLCQTRMDGTRDCGDHVQP